MFNLKSHKNIDDVELLRAELKAFEIFKHANGYLIRLGDESVILPNLSSCINALNETTQELLEHLWSTWHDLANLGDRILDREGNNTGTISNLLFLSAVKNSYRLCDQFTDLDEHQKVIRLLLDSDILTADDHLIRHFNQEYISVRCLHRLIMDDLYRKRIIHRFMTFTKQAQISGPWANLDLPIQERVWEWDGAEEEYFGNRTKSRQNQVRYNPEDATTSGFYYVWNDLTRDPYLFTDMKTDSPYKSRNTLMQP